MRITRKFEWTTHRGDQVTIEGCSDEHLANTIQFSAYYDKFPDNVLKEMKKEAIRRGLSHDFLERAPFPYKDGKGNWVVWNYDSGRIEIVGSYKRG